MKPRLIAIYLLIVLLPLGLLAWLGSELAREDQQRVAMKFRDLLASQLADRNQTFVNGIATREREFQELCERAAMMSPDELRRLVRKERFIRQMFVLKADGAFVFPLLDKNATERERGFFERTKSIWESGIQLGSIGEPSSNFGNSPQRQSFNRSMQRPDLEQDWHPWFWGNGVQFLFWRQVSDGRVVGMEVDRMALVADLVGRLPVTRENDRGTMSGRIVLRDAQNNPLYQWGKYDPQPEEKAVTRIPVAAPLSMWSLEYFAAPSIYPEDLGRSTMLNIGAALVIGCVLMLVLAVYFFRESSREIREASQRVSFVNQVSHELKTPLTNIRMYAELMQGQLDVLEDGSLEQNENLGVIVTESQRLSRMINNVLTFAKGQRGQLKPNVRTEIPDEVVEATLDHFRPAMEAKKIQVSFDGGARKAVAFDPDYLEQILGNLMSNVEKYVPEGGSAKIVSEQHRDRFAVVVTDDGPGIPVAQRDTVFEPFTRLSNRLTDGITGTGIGLTISRELARNHGGELVMEQGEKGATFRVTVPINEKADGI